LNEQTTLKLRELNLKTSWRKNLTEWKLAEFNFKDTYQEQLPPDADDLVALNSSLKDKDGSKDEEIYKYRKNAEEMSRKVKNFIPDSKKISSLRMEEFAD
jgi:hypothetical protein